MGVYRRGDAWYVDVIIQGSRINRKAGASRREAQDVLDGLRRRARTGKLADGQILTFSYTASDYLAHIRDTRSPRTYEMESTDYAKHLQHYFRAFLLADITDHDLLRFQRRQKQKGYGNRTVNIHIGLIRKIYRHGVSMGFQPERPLKFPMLREPKKQYSYLSADDLAVLASGFYNRLPRARFLFGCLTGLRPKELAYLAWKDIDHGMRLLRVRSKPEEGFVIKTDEERSVPLSSAALQILDGLPRRSPWVFSATRRPVLSIRKAIEAAAARVKFPRHITPNSSRHTFAVLSLISGADLQAVQSILGHQSIATTNRYTHSIRESARAAVDLNASKIHDISTTSRTIRRGKGKNKARKT